MRTKGGEVVRAVPDSGDLVTAAMSEKGAQWESVYPSQLLTDPFLAVIKRLV
jgi:hypothetical protein